MPQSLVTPKGESVFACILGLPRLNKYSNENEWTMGMRWKPEDCLHLRNKIDEEFTEAHGKKKGRLPYDFEAYENENGDKISEDNKSQINEIKDKLSAQLSSEEENAEEITNLTNELQSKMQEIGQDIYSQAPPENNENNEDNDDSDTIEGEYKEV